MSNHVSVRLEMVLVLVLGPITRARARDLNYVILLRNEGEDSV